MAPLRGLSVRNRNNDNVAVKKPLKVSTNIIHNKTSGGTSLKSKSVEQDNIKGPLPKKIPSINLAKSLDKHDENEVIGTVKETKSSSPVKQQVKKVDENDLSAFVKNAYNPLDDICPLDEELYQRILKLELADDGLPKFESDEPFDF